MSPIVLGLTRKRVLLCLEFEAHSLLITCRNNEEWTLLFPFSLPSTHSLLGVMRFRESHGMIRDVRHVEPR